MCQQQTFKSLFNHLVGAAKQESLAPSSPIAFAALRLITSSNLVGCSTGQTRPDSLL